MFFKLRYFVSRPRLAQARGVLAGSVGILCAPLRCVSVVPPATLIAFAIVSQSSNGHGGKRASLAQGCLGAGGCLLQLLLYRCILFAFAAS